MIVRPEQLQEWAEIAHTARLLVSRVTNARPPLLECDGAVDDTLAALDEAQGSIAAVLSALREELHQQDQRESGDRDPDGQPRPWPRP